MTTDFMLLLAVDPAPVAALSINLSALAITAGVSTFVGLIGTGLAWVWKQIQAREALSDLRVDTSVETAENALRGRYDAVIAGLKTERENARAAERKAKVELDEVRKESWRATLPLIERTKDALVLFAETEKHGAESVALRLAELNATIVDLKRQLKLNTAQLKKASDP